jgi:hypothetical protein
MARKLTEAQLKKRRLENASAFVIKRFGEMLDEVPWAQGGKPLPKGRRQPPEWVRQAILRSNQTSFSPIYDRDPAKPENQSYGNFIQLMGIFASEGSALVDLPEPIRTAAREDKEFGSVVGRLKQGVERKMAPAINRSFGALKRIQKKLVPANTQQLQENSAHFQQGTTALLTPSGEFAEGRTKKAKLYLVLWMFWPELTRLSNAKQMQAGVEEYADEHFSFKVVEKICTELGVYAGKVGRPRAKKFLQPAKRV